MEPTFLTIEEVVEIHKQQIEKYGGVFGLRDSRALQSAVATPMQTFGGQYLHAGIPAMAAAYLFHVSQNHPFLDGNKRTGANAAITFLLMNDWEPVFSEDELADVALGMAAGKLSKREVTSFFEHHSRPIKR